MELYLIRHTTIKDFNDKCYGFSDVELSPNFESELKLIKAKLTLSNEYRFYTSPLKRCVSLADRLSQDKYIVDERLKELNFGHWEGLSWDEINPEDLKDWTENYVNSKCPGGESFIELYNRSVSFYNNVKETGIHEICIITHAGVIRSILAHVLHIPLEVIPSIKIDFGGITKIEIDNNLTNIAYINR